jgi:hypothetical protein
VSGEEASAPSAATVYDAYLKDELGGQETRKSSFEQRGLAVVTTAGTLVTLLFGLAALSSRSAIGDSLSHGEKLWLTGALGLFILSAVFALATNFPLKYSGPEPSDIETHLDADPEEDALTAQREVAFARVKILTVAQEKNTCKGNLLFVAMLVEVVAVACVGVAIFGVINP